MRFDTIRDYGTSLNGEQRYADLGCHLAANWHEVQRALLIALAVEEAGLRGDLECGHVVPEDQVRATADDCEVCAICHAALPVEEQYDSGEPWEASDDHP